MMRPFPQPRRWHARRSVARCSWRPALAAGHGDAQAQVPKDIHEALLKIGQIVDPACTAKLYRPLMPKADFNTYWPPDAAAPASTAALYPGITIARDQSLAPTPRTWWTSSRRTAAATTARSSSTCPAAAATRSSSRCARATPSTTTSAAGPPRTAWSACWCSAIRGRATGTTAGAICRWPWTGSRTTRRSSGATRTASSSPRIRRAPARWASMSATPSGGRTACR